MVTERSKRIRWDEASLRGRYKFPPQEVLSDLLPLQPYNAENDEFTMKRLADYLERQRLHNV